MSHLVYLALGANLGDRLVNLTQGLILLTTDAEVLRCSDVYETPPWGYLDQPKFLNMAAEVTTKLSPLAFLEKIKFLEEKIGREKSIRFGPRLIDIDILLFDDGIYKDERLEIPHPRMTERAFVLAPLADLAPDRTIPPGGQTVRQHLARVDQGGIKRLEIRKDCTPFTAVRAFQLHPEGLPGFQRLPPSHQREHLKHVFEAKRAETFQKRLDGMIARLSEKGETM